MFSALNPIFASISPEIQSVVLGRNRYTGQETMNRPWCRAGMFYGVNGDLLVFRGGLWVHFPGTRSSTTLTDDVSLQLLEHHHRHFHLPYSFLANFWFVNHSLYIMQTE